MKILATNAAKKFECLKADCPDTCCKAWGMQVDDATFAKYKQNGLEDAVVLENDIRVMKRDPETDYCVKFSEGMCGIHASKGAEMLGDACNFYPRITRKFGGDILMTATLSCPEIARISLFESGAVGEIETERLPQTMVSYDGDLKTHQAFLDACNSESSAAQIMARIYIAATSLQNIKAEDWPGAASFMLQMADGKMPTPEAFANDSIDILQIFAAIFYATHKKMNPRLAEVLEQAQTALGAKINWETLEIALHDKEALYKTLEKIKNPSAPLPQGGDGGGLEKSQQPPPNLPLRGRNDEVDALLKKFIAAELSFSSFPFAGLGENIVEKARFIAFRFALARLLLLCFDNPNEEKIIQIIQSVSRIMAHLSDATLTLKLMSQFGFDKESRLMGLVFGN